MNHPHLVTRAFEANRNLAAAAERDAVVAFLRSEIARLDDDDRADAAELLRALALCIEHGDHLR